MRLFARLFIEACFKLPAFEYWEMAYEAHPDRYADMDYRYCGSSGLKLSPITLGLWHNFGDVDAFENGREMLLHAFDRGITHFDLANNYGPPPGSAESNFGKVLKKDLMPYRDELIISTKAGYDMWPGPYGEGGSRKYLISSLDQSLKRMGLDYVDIFYSHRYDPETPLEETMAALDAAVRSGKALYAGISNYYEPKVFDEAVSILRELGTPCLIHQTRYSMFDRRIEGELSKKNSEHGVGMIVFSPLEQGLLTGRYLTGIPENSRAGRSDSPFLDADRVNEIIAKVRKLNLIAIERGQSLAQMAIRWVLRDSVVTSALVGASSIKQLDDVLACLKSADFSTEELAAIDAACEL